jgi:hypothetical protein
MLRFVFICFVLMSFIVGSHPRDIWFSLESKENKQKFVSYCSTLQAKTTVDAAYFAASKMIQADLSYLPTEQLSLFNQGKEQLEQCVRKDMWNTEIRFIRLTLQCQSPWFLGYHDKIEEDAKIIVDHVNLGYVQKQNAYWKKAIEFIKMQDKIPASLKKTI